MRALFRAPGVASTYAVLGADNLLVHLTKIMDDAMKTYAELVTKPAFRADLNDGVHLWAAKLEDEKCRKDQKLFKNLSAGFNKLLTPSEKRWIRIVHSKSMDEDSMLAQSIVIVAKQDSTNQEEFSALVVRFKEIMYQAMEACEIVLVIEPDSPASVTIEVGSNVERDLSSGTVKAPQGVRAIAEVIRSVAASKPGAPVVLTVTSKNKTKTLTYVDSSGLRHSDDLVRVVDARVVRFDDEQRLVFLKSGGKNTRWHYGTEEIRIILIKAFEDYHLVDVCGSAVIQYEGGKKKIVKGQLNEVVMHSSSFANRTYF